VQDKGLAKFPFGAGQTKGPTVVVGFKIIELNLNE